MAPGYDFCVVASKEEREVGVGVLEGSCHRVQYRTTRRLTTTAPTHTATAVTTIKKINGGLRSGRPAWTVVQYKNFIPTSAYYNTKTLFQLPPTTIQYMPCDVMMSIATTLRYYASQIVRY